MLSDVDAYQTVSMGRESVIVLLNRDGKLNAFLNVCRHCGSRLCIGSAGQQKGSIQCRYHAWTYGLDGRLIGAPILVPATPSNPKSYALLGT